MSSGLDPDSQLHPTAILKQLIGIQRIIWFIPDSASNPDF